MFEKRDHFDHLIASPIHWFSDWPTGDVSRSGAVVYTIWNREGSFIYVGMSGRSFIGGTEGKGKQDRGEDSIAIHVDDEAVISSAFTSLIDLSFPLLTMLQ